MSKQIKVTKRFIIDWEFDLNIDGVSDVAPMDIINYLHRIYGDLPSEGKLLSVYTESSRKEFNHVLSHKFTGVSLDSLYVKVVKEEL